MLSVGAVAKTKAPRLPYEEIAKAILGSSYELSLVFVGDKRMKDLNRTHRNKDYPTNILSFPYEKNSGEIVMDPYLIKKEAKKQNRPYRQYFAYLFIHGCLHLDGFDHGNIMEEKETQYLRRFQLM